MNKQNFLTGTSIVLLSASGAFAADLPTYKGPAPAPVFASFNWAGGYVGALAGISYTSGQHEAGNFTNPFCSNDSVCTQESSFGGVLGLTAGYNWQNGNLVYGIEGDLSGAFANKRTSFVNGNADDLGQSSFNAIGTIRGRVGLAFGNTLAFVTAGYAGINQKLAFAGNYAASGSSTKWVSALAIGGGIEHAISNNWTVKVEGLYLAAGKGRILDDQPVNFKKFRASASTTLLRAGLNYKF